MRQRRWNGMCRSNAHLASARRQQGPTYRRSYSASMLAYGVGRTSIAWSSTLTSVLALVKRPSLTHAPEIRHSSNLSVKNVFGSLGLSVQL